MIVEGGIVVRLTAMTMIILSCLFCSAYAQTVTCNVGASSISFLDYDVFSASSKDTTGTITVSCDKAAQVTISIGISPTSRSFNPRQMQHQSGPDVMNYNLFTNSQRTTIWGDGTGGTSSVSGTARKNSPLVATVYGRIPAGQDVSAGQYRETLSVIVTW